MVSSSSVNDRMGREEWLDIVEWYIAVTVSKTGCQRSFTISHHPILKKTVMLVTALEDKYMPYHLSVELVASTSVKDSWNNQHTAWACVRRVSCSDEERFPTI